MTTIQNIISEGQKKRHQNHINAGKKLKKKYINEGYQQSTADFIKFLEDLSEYDTLDGSARIRVDEKLQELK